MQRGHGKHGKVARGPALLAVLLAGLIGIVVVAPQAHAARGLTTGFGDEEFDSPDAATRAFWLDRGVDAGAGLVILYPSWRTIAPTPPADPTNPADPAYKFDVLDGAVADATARGLEVVIATAYAPAWAEGADRPQDAAGGTWKPDPVAFGKFASALAIRYSGSFTPPGGLGPLPRVPYFQPWAEPNLALRLAPQFENGKPTSPARYRALLNAFYEGIKGAVSSARVVAAGTAPYGIPGSTESLPPVRFWRDVLCLRDRKRLKPTECPQKAKLDVFAHNAITRPGGPTDAAELPDNASTADFGKLKRVVRAAERHKTILPAGRRPLWSTEMWWESSPPDAKNGVPLSRQARWIEQAFYVLWKAGASVAVNLHVGDRPEGFDGLNDTLQDGLYFRDGSPKPALTAFRFPFVADRAGKRTIAWGKSPAAGRLVIERRAGGGWRRVGAENVGAGEVFQRRLRIEGRQSLRARVAGQQSLTWRLR